MAASPDGYESQYMNGAEALVRSRRPMPWWFFALLGVAVYYVFLTRFAGYGPSDRIVAAGVGDDHGACALQHCTAAYRPGKAGRLRLSCWPRAFSGAELIAVRNKGAKVRAWSATIPNAS